MLVFDSYYRDYKDSRSINTGSFAVAEPHHGAHALPTSLGALPTCLSGRIWLFLDLLRLLNVYVYLYRVFVPCSALPSHQSLVP